MKANLCDACLAEGRGVILSTHRVGFSGLSDYRLDLCEKHKNFFDVNGFKTLKKDQHHLFIVFIDTIREKAQREILNIEYPMKKIEIPA